MSKLEKINKNPPKVDAPEQIGLLKGSLFAVEIEAINNECFNELLEKGIIGYKVGAESGKNMFEVMNLGHLRDCKQDIQKVYDVCYALQQLGCTVNEQCGGHIHFDRGVFKNARQLWNVFEIYDLTIEIFELMLNKAGELPRKGTQLFSNRTFPILNKNIKIDEVISLDELIDKIQDLQDDVLYPNIKISKEYNTIEFRAANATLNPDEFVQKLKLINALMKAAIELEDKNLSIINQKRDLKEKLRMNIFIEKKCDFLLDLLFNYEVDKKIFRDRFRTNHILQMESMAKNMKKINRVRVSRKTINPYSIDER